MIPKAILSSSFDFDGPAVSLVPLHRRGVDHGWLQKTAAANNGLFHDYLQDLRPIPGKTVIHVLAVGDEEFYGPNRNGDGFSREDNVTAHRSFKDNGHVFKHHQNKDPFAAVGEVMQTGHQNLMSRIELLLGLDNERCRSEIDGLERGEDLPVSMGSMQDFDVCVPPNTLIALEDGLAPIVDIEIGDRVLSHTGELRKVTDVYRRNYSGDWVTVSARGTPGQLEATGNHPVLVLRGEALYQGPGSASGRSRRLEPDDPRFPAPEWAEIRSVGEDDYLLYPLPRQDGAEPADLGKAYALGFAYGDGSVFGKQTKTLDWRYRGVRYSMDLRDLEVASRLQEALSSAGITVHTYDQPDKNELVVVAQDMEWAQEVDQLVGRGSETKRLSSKVLDWSREARRAVLGGLLDSDGSVTPGKGSARIITCSEQGAWGIRDLCLSLGVVPGIHLETEVASSYGTTEAIWVIHINAADTYQLRDVSVRAARHGRQARCRRGSFVFGGYVAYKVDSITTQTVEDRQVCNLAVECDESYIAAWLAVHNCSICDHRAPTADAHCRHIKRMLGLVLDDGRRVYMKNPKPKYFDISLVFKPADRIAYTLRKVAAANGLQVLGGHDLAEMFGLVPISPKIATLRALASIRKEVPATLRRACKPDSVRADTISELRKQAALHGLPHLLKFLHCNGWLLGPSDFGQVIRHPNPEQLAVADDQFGDLDGLMEDHTELQSLEVPRIDAPIRMAPSALSDLESCCSMGAGPARQRVMKITIVRPAKVAGVLPPEPEARALATLYGCYKLAFATVNSDRPGFLQTVAATF